MKQFEVRMDDLSRSRLIERALPALEDGAIRLAVERFAFTANNMTYAVAGDMLGYWQFFPASEDGWGQIPVWATAKVVESACDDVAVGERFYGYFPPAEIANLVPGKVSERSLVDTAPHRQALPQLYNHYRRLPAEPDAARDNVQILLAPLHMTSFCLWDVLKERDWHSADRILISSASSKTSLGLAYGLHQDDAAPKTVGLTSPGNVDFVQGTGLYDEVLAYDDVDKLDEAKSVLVDMAGMPLLVAALFARLGDRLVYRYNVGATHAPGADTALSGGGSGQSDAKEMFFAPRYILERVKLWGPAEYDRRSGDFVAKAAKATAGWMTIEERAGLPTLQDVYARFHDGSWPPDQGLVIVP
ncbi:DUF2855 family protein [Sphingomicrobium clamense]|uniref:DUF2855 family protein n=1 Tax=Sphingomicrobium clamense TaxID=2851013 RepID=A0ABS6V8C5_9SPHN|nr:DUF2855 family protein [Sphingomicrobium sp. B8]MBW0145816.1 DUF2855 family protein [Sphingomicrobium sp. B8]